MILSLRRPCNQSGMIKYLGLVLSEHLDFRVTVDCVAKSASRALGLLIAKSKAYGGMPFKCFRKLYESIVLPVIHYGSAIWGHKEYKCINAVHNRACRYFLGVGKYTANATVQGDTGLLPPCVGQWRAITRQWCRMVENRLNEVIFKWAFRIGDERCKNWIWSTITFYKSLKLDSLVVTNVGLNKIECVEKVSMIVTESFISKWKQTIRAPVGNRRMGGNKLRTYNKCKDDFSTELYVECNMERKYRRALALFRCGCAPIRIETGRYERLNINERVCMICKDVVEDEKHVLTECPLYCDLRQDLYSVLAGYSVEFNDMSDMAKTVFILSCKDVRTCRICAKYCYILLERRKHF